VSALATLLFKDLDRLDSKDPTHPGPGCWQKTTSFLRRRSRRRDLLMGLIGLA
jgi:hypothetical protein